MSESKEQKVEEVLRLKEEITRLLQNVRDSQALCEKYTHENDYLQDYIGSVMKSTDMKWVEWMVELVGKKQKQWASVTLRKTWWPVYGTVGEDGRCN